jgi:hypothetical protein
MKTLIYLASLGVPAYRRMTELCIRSLRGVGGYRGPILVFTNNGYEAGDQDIEVAQAPSGLDRFALTGFKVAAATSIATADYDRILWLDCDMIAVDEIAPLFSLGAHHVCAMEEEPWTRMTDPSCGDCLSAAERRKAGRRWGINTGCLSFPGPIFQHSTELWRREMEIRRPVLTHWPDQTPFNALVLSGRIPYRRFPRGWIDMPPMYYWYGGRLRVTEKTLLLHFCWPEKDHTVDEMSAILSGLESSTPPGGEGLEAEMAESAAS